MKKLLGFIAVLLFSTLSFMSCEKEPILPDCELNGYGKTTIENKTGYDVIVDCTYQIDGINYEVELYNNESYTYQMDYGKIYIWISFDGENWEYDTHKLNTCEHLTYTWYLDKKKSTDRTLILEIRQNGELIKTVTEFEMVKRK